MRRERIQAWNMETAAEIDAAFAEAFKLTFCNLGTLNAFEQVERICFDHKARYVETRHWDTDWWTAEVSNRFDRQNYQTGQTIKCGTVDIGGSYNKTLALMIAAINWQESKRLKTNQKVRERRARAKAREQAA